MFSERSGVVNIGLEGMMLMGAFFGIYGADKGGSWVVGLLVAMLAGGLLALVHAFFAIHLRADQIVGGMAVNFLALGITGYFFFQLYSGQDMPAGISTIPDVHDPASSRTGDFLGPAFGDLNLMVWLELRCWWSSRTSSSSRRRSGCASAPAASTRAPRTRSGSTSTRSATARSCSRACSPALGGAYLSIGFGGGAFNDNMTAGRGFIALAAMIFGNWRPFGTFCAALLFGFSTALAYRLPAYSDSAATLFQTLPYILTLIAVAGVIGRTDSAGRRRQAVCQAVSRRRPRSSSGALGVAAIPLAIARLAEARRSRRSSRRPRWRWRPRSSSGWSRSRSRAAGGTASSAPSAAAGRASPASGACSRWSALFFAAARRDRARLLRPARRCAR